MIENTDDLREQVNAQVDFYETLLDIARGNYLADDHDGLFAFQWLENAGYDVENYGGDLVDCAADALAESVLELVGVWGGPSKDEAEYKGCRVVVCTGGPHVELDTIAGQWVGYWAGAKVTAYANPATCEYFDSLVGEQ
jgi:hypothetical protein